MRISPGVGTGKEGYEIDGSGSTPWQRGSTALRSADSTASQWRMIGRWLPGRIRIAARSGVTSATQSHSASRSRRGVCSHKHPVRKSPSITHDWNAVSQELRESGTP